MTALSFAAARMWRLRYGLISEARKGESGAGPLAGSSAPDLLHGEYIVAGAKRENPRRVVQASCVGPAKR